MEGLGGRSNSLKLLKEPWPSRASLRNVASEAGVSPEAVRKWRKSPLYRNGLVWLAAQELKAALSAEPKPTTGLARSTRQARALLHVHLKTSWLGPTVSPLDGKTYNDPTNIFSICRPTPTQFGWAIYRIGLSFLQRNRSRGFG